ncbi:GtrA family protein [Gordonia sp. (in: high G+C Gram-positive bacteria)]|uniref:GtrA family protein n=1 Tax=Gordonia sp. (in: high G+C Gram-positive bacteria) TaxID=84139 RepID=UPI00169AF143|nr:GtrA family protein [Gordonia sp. (in: high G+C Gram-positive bacteria)]NLG47646.1 GtrA family protein [Gordonia sp. (in: high G+C Gram-positive bacteria)]
MPTIDGVVNSLPQPVRRLVLKHSEFIKFAIVGGTTFVVDTAVYFLLAFTILDTKPVIARVISGGVAVVLSYILNREWAFKNRGGRERSHEAALFFIISGIGVLLASGPLWLGNNVFHMRENIAGLELAIVDFMLGMIIGNLLGMGFRFWALRRFAFPDEQPRGGEGGSTDSKAAATELSDEELGHA